MMKRMLLVLLMISGLLFAGGTQSQENIKEALGQLEETSKTVLLVSSIIQGVVAVVFLAAGALIYMKKIKGVEKKSLIWMAVAGISLLLGLFLLLGAVLGIIMYFTTGMMIDSMVAG
jgi:hypothetical protein